MHAADAAAPHVFEAGLLAILERVHPGHVPELVAHDPERGWILMRDGGERLREVFEHGWSDYELQMHLFMRDMDETRRSILAHDKKLAKLLDGGKGGAEIAQAVREYEALNDVMGRIVSYASLLYAADTSDPKRQKFFGDIQEKITAISSKLLFFPLELNRLDDDALEKAMSRSELSHFRPWLEDLRKEKPYQLEDKLEHLVQSFGASAP